VEKNDSEMEIEEKDLRQNLRNRDGRTLPDNQNRATYDNNRQNFNSVRMNGLD
jgi:hypothetical protein